MSLKRPCYFCNQPVDIRRRMSLFCSPRCEALHKTLSEGGRPPTLDLSPLRTRYPVPVPLSKKARPPIQPK